MIGHSAEVCRSGGTKNIRQLRAVGVTDARWRACRGHGVWSKSFQAGVPKRVD